MDEQLKPIVQMWQTMCKYTEHNGLQLCTSDTHLSQCLYSGYKQNASQVQENSGATLS